MASDKEHYQPLDCSMTDVGAQAQLTMPQSTASQPVLDPHPAHVSHPQQSGQPHQAAQLHQGSHPAAIAPQQLTPEVVDQQPQYVSPRAVVIAAPAQPGIIENYKARQSKILGIFQLVAGGIVFVLSIVSLALGLHYRFFLHSIEAGTGLLCSVFIFLSGSFAICAGFNKRRRTISAHMGLAIVGSIFAFIMLCTSLSALVGSAYYLHPDYYEEYNPYGYLYSFYPDSLKGFVGMSALWVLSSLVLFIACVWSSSLGCRVICCSELLANVGGMHTSDVLERDNRLQANVAARWNRKVGSIRSILAILAEKLPQIDRQHLPSLTAIF